MALTFCHNSMKIIALLSCISGLTMTAGGGMFSLKTIKLPLWCNGEDEKGIQILSVPKVDSDSPGNWNMINLFDDPYEQYDARRPAAGGIARREDLNMIYAYGIKTLAVYGDKTCPEKPLKLVIDISNAEMTNGFEIMMVARAAAVCIRDLFPKNSGMPLVLRDGDEELAFEPSSQTAEQSKSSPEGSVAPSAGEKATD